MRLDIKFNAVDCISKFWRVSKNNSGFIFGSHLDIFIFLLPIIFFIIFASFFSSRLSPALLTGFFEEAHVYVTIFFTIGSKRYFAKEKFLLIAIPIISFACCAFVYNLFGVVYLYKVFVLFTAYHHIRQQQAWFFISINKFQNLVNSKIGTLINYLAIYALTWGFLLLYMTDKNSFWFISGDLFYISPIFYHPIIITIGLISLVYVFYHIYLFFSKKIFSPAQHLFLLIAAIIYGLGQKLPSTTYLNYALLMGGTHNFIYLYLATSYMLQRKRAGEFFLFPTKNLPLTLLVIIAVSGLLGTIGYSIHGEKITNPVPLFILFSFSLNHYFIDSFFWKKAKHPEGAQVLFA